MSGWWDHMSEYECWGPHVRVGNVMGPHVRMETVLGPHVRMENGDGAARPMNSIDQWALHLEIIYHGALDQKKHFSMILV